MKVKFFFIACLFNLIAQGAEPSLIQLTTEVKRAVLFYNGAYIERETSIYLTAGEYKLTISGLSGQLYPASLRFFIDDAFLMSVNVISKIDPKFSQKVENVRDSIQVIEETIKRKQAMLNVLAEEESMILANKKVTGDATGLQLNVLEGNADFFSVIGCCRYKTCELI